ncbi:MAG TPA: SGNH/GDSL hydrolase family protein [Ruminococcaceae bacterium]|nr:SGNH/GDSL hydrolase family protein [Oscillospiraceae bacterium]
MSKREYVGLWKKTRGKTVTGTDWTQVKMNCLGDSTVWGDDGMGGGGPQISWVAQITAYLPFQTVRNYGVNGSRVVLSADKQDSFVERYAQMEADADIITVLGGVNDFQHDVPLGSLQATDLHTFRGALHYLLTGLLEKYPDKQVLFMTPMQNDFVYPGGEYPNSFQKNRIGLTQTDYVKTMQEACARYSVPVLDLYRSSGISPFIAAQAEQYMPDKMHYNAKGYRRLAKRIATYLSQLIV